MRELAFAPEAAVLVAEPAPAQLGPVEVGVVPVPVVTPTEAADALLRVIIPLLLPTKVILVILWGLDGRIEVALGMRVRSSAERSVGVPFTAMRLPRRLPERVARGLDEHTKHASYSRGSKLVLEGKGWAPNGRATKTMPASAADSQRGRGWLCGCRSN